jgi:hypothetical protein
MMKMTTMRSIIIMTYFLKIYNRTPLRNTIFQHHIALTNFVIYFCLINANFVNFQWLRVIFHTLFLVINTTWCVHT